MSRPSHFGTEMRRLRDAANLPKAHVAAAVGYDVCRWSAVENGREHLPDFLIARAATAVGAVDQVQRLRAMALRDHGWVFCNVTRLSDEELMKLLPEDESKGQEATHP